MTRASEILSPPRIEAKLELQGPDDDGDGDGFLSPKCAEHQGVSGAWGGRIEITIGDKTQEVHLYGCVWCGTWSLDA